MEKMSSSYGDALEQGQNHMMDKPSDRNTDRQNEPDPSHMREAVPEESEEETDVSKSIIDIGRSDRIALADSFVAILAGLAVSAVYKRRHQ